MERRMVETKENFGEVRSYAVLVGLRSPVLGRDSADEESLAELAALVETAGGESVGMILQGRDKPDPHSFTFRLPRRNRPRRLARRPGGFS